MVKPEFPHYVCVSCSPSLVLFHCKLCFVLFFQLNIGFLNHWKTGAFSQFLLLENLNNASKGFLVNDTLIVEAEIMAVSNIKLFS